jgi:hypothetical protein
LEIESTFTTYLKLLEGDSWEAMPRGSEFEASKGPLILLEAFYLFGSLLFAEN